MKTFSELRKNDILSKEQMRFFKGGDQSSATSGMCGYIGSDGRGACNVSKSFALFMHEWVGGRWCCDSCPETDYCGGAQ